MLLRQLIYFILPLIIAFNASSAEAWSALGHGDIADAAFERLSAKQQQALAPVLASGPWAKSKIQRSPIAAAAIWPDRIRQQPLEQLFKRYGSGKVPELLRPYRVQNTAQWHFVNAQFLTLDGKIIPASKQPNACPPASYGQLYEIWAPLLGAFKEADDVRDQAILLAFITHMLGDAYQPLHVLAALDKQCDHDRGGNRFCIERGKGNRCKTNLHQLWDGGFGLFNTSWDEKIRFKGKIGSLNVNRSWLSAAEAVYPQGTDTVYSSAYQQRASRTVRKQANLAAAHLHAVLIELGGIHAP